MAAHDESGRNDLARRPRRSPDAGKARQNFPLGSDSSNAGERDDSPDSFQISDRELEGLLGLAPSFASATDNGLCGCPPLVRLNDILENNDAASEGELLHISVCPDCVSRVRAFRKVRREEALDLFESKVDLMRDTRTAFTPIVQEAEGHARLLFLMIAQDADPQRWIKEAWSCTRKVAFALRIARNQKATLAEMEIILELFMTAIATGASNPVATCSRLTDGAWPIVEMVKHTAIHIALNDPTLFKPFSRHLGATVHLATRRMKAMLTYAMLNLLDQRILPSTFAPVLVHEIAECDRADAVRLVLATLLPERSDLSADLRFAVSDAMDDPRVEELSSATTRAKLAIETALQPQRTSTDDAFENVRNILDRLCNDVFIATEPEEAMLRFIALRHLVRDMTQKAVRPDLVALFRSIAELVLERSSRRFGSTFYAMEVVSVFRDVATVFAEIIDGLPTSRFLVRQGVIISLAEGYAALYRGGIQGEVPHFRPHSSRWEFDRGDSASPLDDLCGRIAVIAFEKELADHLRWLNKRLELWTMNFESPVDAI